MPTRTRTVARRADIPVPNPEVSAQTGADPVVAEHEKMRRRRAPHELRVERLVAVPRERLDRFAVDRDLQVGPDARVADVDALHSTADVPGLTADRKAPPVRQCDAGTHDVWHGVGRAPPGRHATGAARLRAVVGVHARSIVRS